MPYINQTFTARTVTDLAAEVEAFPVIATP